MNTESIMNRLGTLEDQLFLITKEIQGLIKELSPEFEEQQRQERLTKYMSILEFINEKGEDWNQEVQKEFYINTSSVRGRLSVSEYLRSLYIEVKYRKLNKKNKDEWAILKINKDMVESLAMDNK